MRWGRMASTISRWTSLRRAPRFRALRNDVSRHRLRRDHPGRGRACRRGRRAPRGDVRRPRRVRAPRLARQPPRRRAPRGRPAPRRSRRRGRPRREHDARPQPRRTRDSLRAGRQRRPARSRVPAGRHPIREARRARDDRRSAARPERRRCPSGGVVRTRRRQPHACGRRQLGAMDERLSRRPEALGELCRKQARCSSSTRSSNSARCASTSARRRSTSRRRRAQVAERPVRLRPALCQPRRSGGAAAAVVGVPRARRSGGRLADVLRRPADEPAAAVRVPEDRGRLRARRDVELSRRGGARGLAQARERPRDRLRRAPRARALGAVARRVGELGFEVVSRAEAPSGITTFRTSPDSADDEAVVYQLLDERILVSIRYTSGVGGIRISTHFYNDDSDIDALVSALARLRQPAAGRT